MVKVPHDEKMFVVSLSDTVRSNGKMLSFEIAQTFRSEKNLSKTSFIYGNICSLPKIHASMQYTHAVLANDEYEKDSMKEEKKAYRNQKTITKNLIL